MSYCFHDLAHIILYYLDDLIAHSKHRAQHIHDFCTIFFRYHKYNIHLKSLKSVFCVPIGHLLGFIMTKDGIKL